jgi:hypothetical protein
MPWLVGEDHHQPPDRARLFAERVDGDVYRVVFLCYDNRARPAVPTVLRAEMLDPPERAYLAVRAQEVFDDV